MGSGELLTAFQKAVKRGHFLNNPCGHGLLGKLWSLIRFPRVYAGWILLRLGMVPFSEITGQTFWNRSIILPGDDRGAFALSKTGYLGDAAEIALTNYLIRRFDKNDVFYDIGANYGFYTYLAEELIEGGQIHAFEPLQKNFSYIEKNLMSNGKVFLNAKAVYSSAGKIEFNDTSVSSLSGRSSLINEFVSDLKTRKVLVETITLDEYVNENTVPTIIKIDAEGAELSALQGGQKILDKYGPEIALEVWGNELAYKAVEWLTSRGYSAFKIEDNGSLIGYNIGQMREFVFQGETRNFIFKR